MPANQPQAPDATQAKGSDDGPSAQISARDSVRGKLADIFSTRNHSHHYSSSRAEQIGARFRVLSAVLAALLLAWIPVDYFVVPADVFWKLAATRGLAAILLVGLSTMDPRIHKLKEAYLRLAALVLILVAFYAITRLAVDDLVAAGMLTGYTFLPFILVTMQALFPLVILEAVVFAAPVLAVGVGIEFHTRPLLDVAILGDIWLLGSLVCLTWWIQATQLDTLLRLYRQATRDHLTGLYNRRVLMERMQDEVRRAQRYRHPLAILIMDLDRFKRVNDRHGHLAGDAVLKVFADIAQGVLRNTDLMGRYGGEEFLAILPETNLKLASEAAERIRAACHAAEARSPDGEQIPFTTSVGVAEWAPPENVTTLLGRVDDALFEAKAAGRDRVYLAEQPASDVEQPKVT